MTNSFESLVELFSHHQKTHPDRELFTFLDSKGLESKSLSVSKIYSLAIQGACYLQSIGIEKNEKVVLLCNPGYDFVLAFMACLYSGVIAVPCYPPMNEKHMEKVLVIGKD